MSTKSGAANTWLLGTGILVVLGIFYLLFFSTKRYDWAESYDPDNDLPYGTSIFKNLIENAHPNQPFFEVADSIHLRVNTDTLPKNSNYFLIGRELYLDSNETDFLLDFVEKGNNAFLLSSVFSYTLIDTLIDVESEDYYYYDLEEGIATVTPIQRSQDTSIFMNLWGKDDRFERPVECKYVRNNEPRNKVWSYFHEAIFAKNNAEIDVLGYYDDENTNYIRIPYGDGFFYLHSTPLAFTNYALLKDSGFHYVAYATAFTGDGTVLWDDYNRNYQYVQDSNYSSNDSGSLYEHEEGPLSFILSERSLKWSWFVLLAAIFLYMFFGAKRKQRSIPVIHPLKNTSLDFAETIGTMFRMENDHAKLVKLKMRLFKAFVRERYGLRTAIEQHEEPELIKDLAERSDLEAQQVKELFSVYHQLEEKTDLEAIELIRFHQQLEQFYQNAR